ncbi:MAG: hypothetical protein IH943_01510 [Acidobacteria bacterium]|nr:hypothetical protein [Acidobacteriota bacterium]
MSSARYARSAASLILALALVATACGESTEPDTNDGTTTTVAKPDTNDGTTTTVAKPATATTVPVSPPPSSTTTPPPITSAPPPPPTTAPPPPPTTSAPPPPPTTSAPPPPPTTAPPPTTPPGGTIYSVSLHDDGGSFEITPTTITISSGDTVRWTNTGNLAHTSTSGSGDTFPGSPDGIWDSPDMGPGASFSQTFTSVGTFTYFCRFHPILMGTAFVVVTP